MSKPVRLLLVHCLAAAMFAMPARADDVPDGAQAFLDNLGQNFSVEPSYEAITANNSGQVTITNLTYGGDAFIAKADRITLAAITDQGNGLYEIGDVTFSGVSIETILPEFSITFSAPKAHAEHWFVSRLGPDATAMEKFRATAVTAKSMTADDLTLSMAGFDFHAEHYEATRDGDPRTGSGRSFVKLSDLAAPPELLAKAPPDSPLKRLGYENIAFDISANGDLKMDADVFDVAMDLAITGHNIGTLSISVAASSIPFAVLAELERADNAGEEPDFSAMMPQLQKTAFVGAQLRFEDGSITKKLLPLAAAEQGLKEEQLIAMAGPMVQMGLMELKAPDFSSQAAAVDAFLKKPKSITLALKPPRQSHGRI